MKNKLVILLASFSCLCFTNCTSFKNPFAEISPISGDRKVSIGVEATIVGKTIGTGIWVKEK